MRVVIPSVQYADFLAVTLPAWQAVVPTGTLRVVTAPDDTTTVAVARAHGVPCVVTDAWYRDGCRFNKARALDEAFGFSDGGWPPRKGEACLALDADVYPVGTLPHGATLDRHTIYSCPRYQIDSPEDLAAHLSGRLPVESLQLILPRTRGRRWPDLVPHSPEAARDVARRCLGFVQLFRYRPGLTFGSFHTAGKYDLVFRDQFQRRGIVPGLYVLHLGEQSRANWRGRVVRRWGGV